MEEHLTSAEELKGLLALLSPGLIILGIRQSFLSSPAPSFQERALSYAGVSAVYFTAIQPVLAYIGGWLRSPAWLTQWIEYLLLPAVLGVIYGAITHHDLIFKLAGRLKLSPVHNAPSAWDYAFRKLPRATYLSIHLNDGTTVSGAYAGGSFTSSVREERDILISDVFDIQDGVWTPAQPPKSMLLCGRDIRVIEFFQRQP